MRVFLLFLILCITTGLVYTHEATNKNKNFKHKNFNTPRLI